MFAIRFDPTQIVEATSQKGIEPKSIVPLKRAKNDEDEEELYSDDGEEIAPMKNKDDYTKQGASVEEPISEDSSGESVNEDDENDSSDEEDLHDHQYAGLGYAFEEEDDVDLEGGDTPLQLGKSHSSVISRFQKSMKLQGKGQGNGQGNGQVPSGSFENEEDKSTEAVEHALDHIPQPAVVRSNAFHNVNEHKSIAWLHTTKIHYDNSMIKPFDSFSNELEPKLLENIKRNFANTTFPIQTVLLDNMLPILNFSLSTTKKHMTRRVGDILVNASTGSGKTLGYSIPIVQMLSKRTVNKLRVLIVLPTKLLISQVYETVRKLSQGTGLIISVSKLEVSLKEEHGKFLKNEPDILIVTPGRLVDHLNMNSISLKNLCMLVLDEADHLLNQSFQNWCPELMNKIKTDKTDQMPGNIIKMVFSATLTTNTEKLHGLQLYNPKLFVMDSVKLYNLPPKLQEYNISIPTAKSVFKPLILLHLIDKIDEAKILVFVKSNEASLRLASLLNIIMNEKIGSQHKIASINSNNTQGENKKLVHEFTVSLSSKTKNEILITTDLMSRGIDINDITDVINYDLPIGSQQYVHRCGRTARAQTFGNAYNLLVGKGEKKFWAQSIDVDMSRDVNGCSPKDWSERKPEISEGDEQLPEASKLTDVSAEEAVVYKKCLDILQQHANAR